MSSNTLVSSSVSAAAVPATYSFSTTHTKNETADEAISIGSLYQDSVIISVSDQGAAATASLSKSFVSQGGCVDLEESFESYVGQLYTRFQLFDSQGIVIADNEGSAEEQAAYSEWKAGTLLLDVGTYTIVATPNTEYTGDLSLTVDAIEQQGTTLQVSSSLTGNNQAGYYNFSFSGTNMKLDLAADEKVRVVLYDSDGKVVADSDGNSYQKSKYAELVSGVGLEAESGDYMVAVSYSDNANIENEVDYTFKLYSGNTYSVIYKYDVESNPYDGSAAGSVEATDDALLYGTTDYNKIDATAASAINIGWMKANESMLDVYSMLTNADHTDYYSFTFQEGDHLKFDFDDGTTRDESLFRVQLFDSSGILVIADSEGTEAQRAAYEELISASGLEADPGKFVIKISYADGVTKREDAVYEFGLYSGTIFSVQYKTTATAQTYANALLNGNLTSDSTGLMLASILAGGDDGGTLWDALKSMYG
ncbi:MAG: hypothetical protein PHS57_04115 [Alphaproteobacteria bacterium]|nr:hypothetical protein [Alphaproteobacteria bacterium]